MILYRQFDVDGHLLYVGISDDFLTRMGQHSHGSVWFPDVARITLERFATREEAIEAEDAAVTSEAPRYNIQYHRGARRAAARAFREVRVMSDLVDLQIRAAKAAFADRLLRDIKALEDENSGPLP